MIFLPPGALAALDKVAANSELRKEDGRIVKLAEFVPNTGNLVLSLGPVDATDKVFEPLPARIEYFEIHGILLTFGVVHFEDALHGLNRLELVYVIAVEEQAHLALILRANCAD